MSEEETEQNAMDDAVVGITGSDLAGMSDAALALFQASRLTGTPQYFLAEREWQRRMISHQITEQQKIDERVAASNRWWSIGAAVIGVVGTLAGAVIGAVLQAKLSLPTAPPEPKALSSPAVQGLQPSASAPPLSASIASQALRASQAAPSR